jgi:hypothetical protein
VPPHPSFFSRAGSRPRPPKIFGSAKSGVGSFRTAHGASRAGGETLVFEAVPDGMRSVEPGSAEPLERREGGKFTSAGASAAARRRHELAKVPDALRGELALVPFEGFEPFDTGRKDLLAAKAGEIVEATGAADVGVMSVLRGWSWLVAFAEYYAHQAATTGDAEAAGRARQFFKDASIELAKAWEFSRVAADSRPKLNAREQLERRIKQGK